MRGHVGLVRLICLPRLCPCLGQSVNKPNEVFNVGGLGKAGAIVLQLDPVNRFGCRQTHLGEYSAFRARGVGVPPSIQGAPPSGETYFPLILVFLYLAGFVALSQFTAGRWSAIAGMNAFMGGFFIVFSFFKLLNIRGFAEAYRTYDIVASGFAAYGYLFPFIELTLGVCYLTAFAPLATNLANCAVMSVGAIGVARALLRKNSIQCACLGTVFNLPMSRITLVEDLLMVGMSAVMIVAML